MSEDLIGRTINRRYVILALIAEGGMGRVYQARDEQRGDQVAIKRVVFSKIAPADRPLFESNMLQDLRHPNLPQVRDVFQDKRAHYLVMEYIPGPTLQQRVIAQRRLPPRVAVEYTLTLLEVLHYLHHQHPPIIHRDVKPANIKFHTDGRLMLVDFGIAKELIQDERTRMSARGLTPGYGPPEQYKGGTRKSSDLFSVGCVLYFMLVGEHPADAMERVAHSRFKLDPSNRFTDIPENLAIIVQKATALPINDRFQVVEELAVELQRVLPTLPIPPAPPPVGKVLRGTASGVRGTTQPGNREALPANNQTLALYMGLALVLLVAVIGGLWNASDASTFSATLAATLEARTSPAPPPSPTRALRTTVPTASPARTLESGTVSRTPVPTATLPTVPTSLRAAVTAGSTTVLLTWEWRGEPLPASRYFAIGVRPEAETAWLPVNTRIPVGQQQLAVDLSRFDATPLYGKWEWYVAVVDRQGQESSPRSLGAFTLTRP